MCTGQENNIVRECRGILPAWASVPLGDFVVSVMHGGLTNAMYRCGRARGWVGVLPRFGSAAVGDSPT
jgi:hypothetical protein